MNVDVKKQIWVSKGKNFTVEIVHWVEENYPEHLKDIIEKNHWNVYAYIFPTHPLFNVIVSDSLHDYGIDLPLHWGSSYHKWEYDKDGDVILKKIGSDYQHCDDERFAKYTTKEEAFEVFRDAEELFEFIESKLNKGY